MSKWKQVTLKSEPEHLEYTATAHTIMLYVVFDADYGEWCASVDVGEEDTMHPTLEAAKEGAIKLARKHLQRALEALDEIEAAHE